MVRTDPAYLSLRRLVNCWAVELHGFRGLDGDARRVHLVWPDGRFAIGEIEAVTQAAHETFTDSCDANGLWEKCHRTGIICQLIPNSDDKEQPIAN